MSTTMLQVCLYPTSERGRLLIAHCLEYISTVNVLASALDADMIPSDGFSTKNFVALNVSRETGLSGKRRGAIRHDARPVDRRKFWLQYRVTENYLSI